MSQPIDTDTFVSAELDLGIDLVSLEPIEEEDADYLDSVETIDKFDSKDSMGNINISNSPANPGERQDAIHNSSRSLVREASENKIRFDDTEDERRQEDIKSDSSRGQDSSDSQIDESDAITVEVNNSSGSAIGLDRALIGTKESSESEPSNDSVEHVVETPIHGEGSLSPGHDEDTSASPIAHADKSTQGATAVELDDVGEESPVADEEADDLDEKQVDIGEKSDSAEVQVDHDISANAGAVAEGGDDEGPETETVKSVVVEEEANATELDGVGADSPTAGEDTEEDADGDETQQVDAGEEIYASEVQVADDIIASTDQFAEDDDEGAEGVAVEEETNAAELDNISVENPVVDEDAEEDANGLDEAQEVDVGEESYAAEVQVEDDTTASSNEFAEGGDEDPAGETVENVAVEEEANAAELDNVGEDSTAADEDTEEDADNLDKLHEESVAEESVKVDVQEEDDIIASADELEGDDDEGPDLESVDPEVEEDSISDELDDDVEHIPVSVEILEDDDKGIDDAASTPLAPVLGAAVLTGAAIGLFAESSRDNAAEEDRKGVKVDDEDEGIPYASGDVEIEVNGLINEVPEDSVAENSNAEDVQVEDGNIATIDDIIRDKDEETNASELDGIGVDTPAAGEEEMQEESVADVGVKEDVQVEDDNIASTDEPEVNEDEGPDPESVEPAVEDDTIAPEVDDDVEHFPAAVEILEDDEIDVDADVGNGNEISGVDMSAAEIDEQELINAESDDLRNESDDGSDSDVSPLGMESHDEKKQVSFTLDVGISEVAHNGPESNNFAEGAMPSIPQDTILQSDDEQFDALLDDGGIDGDDSPLLDGDNAADVETESALFQASIPEPEAEHTKIATKFSDAPKTTSFASAKSRALRNDGQWKSSQTLSTSRTSSRSMSRPRTSSTSMSRPSSSGRSSIHTQLYERSIPQQEEGKKRRHEVEDSLRRRADERNGKYCDQVYHQREKNDSKRESLKEEFSKPKKISISDAEHLYQRLLSYKIKTDERRIQLRKDRDAREMEWLNNMSKNKISPQEACGIYYRGTVSSRCRSRGRE